MPYVTGPIGPGGAVVDVLIGVPGVRASLLRKSNFPVPAAVPVRALIDTGASLSGFAPRVFRALDLRPLDQIEIYTPSTRPGSPYACDRYLVGLALVAGGRSHPFPDLHVIETDCWLPDEGIEALIGRDILSRCNFWYVGIEDTFNLSFA